MSYLTPVIERSIVYQIVLRAINLGYLVSVHDGEERVVKKSQDEKEIMAAIMSTDDDVLTIYDGNTIEEKKIGFISLVYGNDGDDVISDYTANPEMEAFLEPIQDFCTALSEDRSLVLLPLQPYQICS